MIALLRIDDRLVHGQVVEGWLPHLRAEAVLIVSDSAAQDEMQQALMRMALPPSVELIVLTVEKARALAPALAGDRRRILILTPSPAEALALVESGLAVDRVNVGGLHFTVGKVQLGRALFLDKVDETALRGLVDKGIRLEGRSLPSEKTEDLGAILGTAKS